MSALRDRRVEHAEARTPPAKRTRGRKVPSVKRKAGGKRPQGREASLAFRAPPAPTRETGLASPSSIARANAEPQRCRRVRRSTLPAQLNKDRNR